ncbi:MAG: hypothetical protein J6Y47_01735 [Bacteroidales bacterium]|nr:hypothetical protein [Bacteroidales bacterium]
MLIYSPKNTSRLQYVLQFIFEEQLGIPYQICTRQEYFDQYQGDKMAYSPIPCYSIQIIACSLLSEHGVQEHDIHKKYINNTLVLYGHDHKDLLGFDIFAAVFYCLSRYEEYLPKAKKDRRGRWIPSDTALHDKAWVDRWILLLQQMLLMHFPHLKFKEKKFVFIPTYDIDIAYCYTGKGCLLTLAGYMKHLLKGKWNLIHDRHSTLAKKTNDPYDTFNYLEQLHTQYQLKAIYFFLVAKKRTTIDKNIPRNYAPMQNLISRLATNQTIGLHASYHSFQQADIQQEEIAWLQQFTPQNINNSRQHYLCIAMPGSYQQLIANKICRDFSLGMVDTWGFRACTCNTFLFYNIYTEQITPLRLYPLIGMENGIKGDTVEEMWQYILPYINETIQLKGTLTTLFHNQSFGMYADKDFNRLYELLLKHIADNHR